MCSLCGSPAKPANVPLNGWGIGKPICADFREATKKLFTQYGADFSSHGPLLDDYVALYVLMAFDPGIVVGAFQRLGQEIDASVNALGDPVGLAADGILQKRSEASQYHVRLSRILERYEALCHFPNNRIVFPGLLSADEFESSYEMGPNKDPGAGVLHGDLTHRFQFHAVMRLMTADFTAAKIGSWSVTPLQLWVSFGSALGKQARAWGWIFDNNNGGLNFTNPDNVYAALRSENQKSWNSAFIQENLNRRFVKKFKLWQVISKIIDEEKDPGVLKAMQDHWPNRRDLEVAVESMLYVWKKIGRGAPSATTDPKEQVVTHFTARAHEAVGSPSPKPGYHVASGATGVLQQPDQTTMHMIDANDLTASALGLNGSLSREKGMIPAWRA